MAVTQQERYERSVTIEGVDYLTTIVINGSTTAGQTVSLTATTSRGQLQLQAPAESLPDWLDALAETVGRATIVLNVRATGETRPQASRNWTPEETQRLRTLWNQRNRRAIDVIAQILGRRPSGIRAQLSALGLLSPTAAAAAAPQTDQEDGEEAGPPPGQASDHQPSGESSGTGADSDSDDQARDSDSSSRDDDDPDQPWGSSFRR